ncbi:MAG: hypothetical protein UT38_C0017G0028 [Microgenomates group bacterium GW2011_GWA2_39_19]|nr:MAG: hypothetical protein UT38_C0017G0028 [Microgenomates group bacterium GW2011_GWA2_39_19]
MSPTAVLEKAREKVAVTKPRGGIRWQDQVLHAVAAPPEPAAPVAPAVSDKTREAIEVIQSHLDREARNRCIATVRPVDLCPLQKVEMAHDLADVLK